jgi:signal transduction histidine kinase
MIRVCMTELARSSAAERDALWEALDRSPGSEPQADAQRQRVSRLRKRLAKAIHDRLGESAKSLLASDLEDE